MKYLLCFLLLSIAATQTGNSTNSQIKTEMNKKLLRHAVMFKFKDDASAEDIKKVENAFRDLKNKIPLIKKFEWGTNISPENINQGFTHFFFASFNSEKDRDAYLVHPDHKAFVAILQPHLDKVLVMDYWAQQ